jgi:MFS family permease
MARILTSVEDDSWQFVDVRRRLKAIFIGSVGNLVEWYDFYVYTAFALYFAGSFFPGNDPVIQQLNATILFAVGFLVRPIGGWLFGHLADHYGRCNALMLSVLLMCAGSGLSLGGEYGASATSLFACSLFMALFPTRSAADGCSCGSGAWEPSLRFHFSSRCSQRRARLLPFS